MGVVCFSDEGGVFIYKCGGCPIVGALGLVGGGCEKNRKMSEAHAPSIPPPALWETLCVDIELLLCMLSSAVDVLCMYVLFYKHY